MKQEIFNTFHSGILDNLSRLSDNFVPDTSFSSDSSVAETLESLAGQINNLRIFLIKGYHDKFYSV